MFPALPDREPEKIPKDLHARQFPEIKLLLPVLVRRGAQSAWSESGDVYFAALEIFSEEDGIHSFYQADSLEALVAIAAFMSSGGEKPYSRAVYFFAMPTELIDEFDLRVSPAPAQAKCIQMTPLHRHVEIGADKKGALFSRIQERGWYNYRVDRFSMRSMVELLAADGCIEYVAGPCACDSATTVA